MNNVDRRNQSEQSSSSRNKGTTRQLLKAAVAISMMTCAGCAGVSKGTGERITITTPNCPGAQCVLENKKGSWSLQAPGSVVVFKSDDPLKITCGKNGKEKQVTVDSTRSGSAAGEALLFGVFSAASAATDTRWEYPDEVALRFACN